MGRDADAACTRTALRENRREYYTLPFYFSSLPHWRGTLQCCYEVHGGNVWCAVFYLVLVHGIVSLFVECWNHNFCGTNDDFTNLRQENLIITSRNRHEQRNA